MRFFTTKKGYILISEMSTKPHVRTKETKESVRVVKVHNQTNMSQSIYMSRSKLKNFWAVCVIHCSHFFCYQ